MKKTYAQKDADGNLVATIHTKEELAAPWFLLDQDYVSGDMVWDEGQGKFITPTP